MQFKERKNITAGGVIGGGRSRASARTSEDAFPVTMGRHLDRYRVTCPADG